MSTCPKCGHELSEGSSFCSHCGLKLQPPSAGLLCPACGKSLGPGARFCTGCGAPVEPPPAPRQAPPSPPEKESAPPPENAPAPPQADLPPLPDKSRPADRHTTLALLIALPLLAVVVGLLLFFGLRWYSAQARLKELAENGSQALSSGQYLDAQEDFQALLELQPENTQAILGLARAYLHQDECRQAAQCLEKAPPAPDSPDYETFLRLQAAALLDPGTVEINTDHFPQIHLSLPCGGQEPLPPEGIRITEDGKDYSPSSYETRDGVLTLSYTAPATELSEERRQVAVTLTLDEFTFLREETYSTPHFEPAQIQLVSTDVSRYPLVTAYFRVEDPLTGEPVEGLETGSFQISERLQGGQYLSREVHSALPLEGNRGLSIDLVADKSSSISLSDMGKIKGVMTDFVNSLHYQDGDKAEVLAFDSIVQQMCYYTGDSALLVNGIQNMSTDGRTALYDAVHDGIHNAALQGGARCVIAFTDGMDNESRYSPHEIVQYSLTNQVPVYIIGVGHSVETSTLRSMAEGTGGRYWFIDDLYDLQEIFDEIYAEQKKLYAVEYTSDAGADAYTSRELDVSVSGSGYRAQGQMSFQAVPSVSGLTHANRYELIQEALSWEEAARRCQEMGGHLATITSQDEMDLLVSMAEDAGLRYIWLGGYTSYDSMGSVFAHWITGEEFSYQAWSAGEPSRVDLDGVDEWYLMLWNIPSLGGWTWNDQRNDPASAVPSMVPSMGFICEYEN